MGVGVFEVAKVGGAEEDAFGLFRDEAEGEFIDGDGGVIRLGDANRVDADVEGAGDGGGFDGANRADVVLAISEGDDGAAGRFGCSQEVDGFGEGEAEGGAFAQQAVTEGEGEELIDGFEV